MKLLSISIEKLFGQFDYNINFNQEEGITILTGPNGYGKTTILSIIAGLFNKNFNYILSVPFQEIDFTFDDSRKICVIKKVEDGIRITQNGVVRETYGGGIRKVSKIKLRFKLIVEDAVSEIFESPGKNQDMPLFDIIPQGILTILKSITVYLVKDQRLVQEIVPKLDGIFKFDGSIKNDGKSVPVNTIKIYSRGLCNKISERQAEEKKLEDELSPSLTKRFKEYKNFLPASDYQERFQKVSEKYKKLQEYGIYQNDLESTTYEGDDRRFFSLNLEDWEKKIAIYDELLDKITLFLSIMNGKGLVNKTFTINAEKGFCFNTIDGKTLQLTELSSGEQHQTILLYELLFNAPPDSLVLIDEPETSMHVAWQIEFLRDIEKIAKLSGLSFIIATHSPDLINDKMDLCVDLFENAQGAKQHD